MDASIAWKEVSDEVKAECKRKAAANRAVFKHILDPVKCAHEALDQVEYEQSSEVRSPWGLGGPLWPLKLSTLEECLKQPGFVRDFSAKWAVHCGDKQEHDESFPDKVHHPEFCLNKLPMCATLYPAGVQEVAAEIRKDLQVIVSPRRAPLAPGQVLLVKFKDVQQITVVMSYLKAPFTCELLLFPQQPRDSDLLNTAVDLTRLVEVKEGLHLLPVRTEVEWSTRLAQALDGGDIEWSRLGVTCPAPEDEDSTVALSKILITKIERVDLQAEKASQKQGDVVTAALRALQRSQQTWQQRHATKRVAKDR